MKPLTILVAPIDCVGHVNACAGSTKPLLSRGHRVIFHIEQSFKGKLAALGFEEDIYCLKTEATAENAGESWANDLFDSGVIGPTPVEKKYTALLKVFHHNPRANEVERQCDDFVRKAIEKYKPNLIWIDTAYILPAVYHSGIPWVINMSLTPVAYISIETDQVPPNGSGYPSSAPRDEAWYRFKKINRLFRYSKEYNDFIEHELGYARYPNDVALPLEHALLALYAFPEEYNFQAIRDKGWFNIEVFNKNPSQEIIRLDHLVPKTFISNDLNGKWTGKWVYLSMGSMGSIDLKLMNRLLDTIKQTNHKYIVSKGPRHAELNLPHNAWGDRFLPQAKLVPLMDLVITHGGNNTVTETFALGKPMIVMPLFGDQYDNAQRLHETGLGFRVDPYDFETNQLIQAIDRVMNDETMRVKLEQASKRILSTNQHEKLADQIENLMIKSVDSM